MKSKEMLKAIGNIDDKFIADAEVKSDNKEVKEKRVTRKWVKWTGAVAAVLVVCIVGVGAVGSMFGGAAKMASDSEIMPGWQYSKSESFEPESMGLSSNGTKYLTDSSYANEMDLLTEKQEQANANLVKQEVKLIYTANMHLQTTKYDESLEKIKALVGQYNGYFEASNIQNGSMYYVGYQCGYYTIRIPQENYKTFLEAAGTGNHVVSLEETVRDVGEQYYNIESQIETLKIKEERLQNLLKKAENLGDIITIESELTNVEQQLKGWTLDLNHYDSLIGYSTIHLTLEEVSAFSDSAYKESFGARFARAIKRGAVNFVEGVEDFIIWIGSNIIGLVILAIIIFVIWKLHLIRRIIRKITGKQ